MDHVQQNDKKKALVAASVAGLMALAWGTVSLLGLSKAHADEAAAGGEESAPCYGVNACKGTGECGGKDHACAGENACKGQGWIKMPKDKCLGMEGGRLTAEQAS